MKTLQELAAEKLAVSSLEELSGLLYQLPSKVYPFLLKNNPELRKVLLHDIKQNIDRFPAEQRLAFLAVVSPHFDKEISFWTLNSFLNKREQLVVLKNAKQWLLSQIENECGLRFFRRMKEYWGDKPAIIASTTLGDDIITLAPSPSAAWAKSEETEQRLLEEFFELLSPSAQDSLLRQYDWSDLIDSCFRRRESYRALLDFSRFLAKMTAQQRAMIFNHYFSDYRDAQGAFIDECRLLYSFIELCGAQIFGFILEWVNEELRDQLFEKYKNQLNEMLNEHNSRWMGLAAVLKPLKPEQSDLVLEYGQEALPKLRDQDEAAYGYPPHYPGKAWGQVFAALTPNQILKLLAGRQKKLWQEQLTGWTYESRHSRAHGYHEKMVYRTHTSDVLKGLNADQSAAVLDGVHARFLLGREVSLAQVLAPLNDVQRDAVLKTFNGNYQGVFRLIHPKAPDAKNSELKTIAVSPVRQLTEVLNLLNREQCRFVLQGCRSLLPEILSSVYSLEDLFSNIQSDDKPFILDSLRNSWGRMIESHEDLSEALKLLGVFRQTQNKVLTACDGRWETLITTAEALASVLAAPLNDDQKNRVLDTTEEYWETLIKNKKGLLAVLTPLNAAQKNRVLKHCKGRWKKIIGFNGAEELAQLFALVDDDLRDELLESINTDFWERNKYGVARVPWDQLFWRQKELGSCLNTLTPKQACWMMQNALHYAGLGWKLLAEPKPARDRWGTNPQTKLKPEIQIALKPLLESYLARFYQIYRALDEAQHHLKILPLKEPDSFSSYEEAMNHFRKIIFLSKPSKGRFFKKAARYPRVAEALRLLEAEGPHSNPDKTLKNVLLWGHQHSAYGTWVSLKNKGPSESDCNTKGRRFFSNRDLSIFFKDQKNLENYSGPRIDRVRSVLAQKTSP